MAYTNEAIKEHYYGTKAADCEAFVKSNLDGGALLELPRTLSTV